MLEIASNIIMCLIASCIIGFVMGFLIGRGSKKEEETVFAMNPIFTKQGNVYNKPFILGNPRPCGKDDLKVVEGIDVVTEAALNGIGIFHYDQISKWSQNNCAWVEEHLSIQGKILEDKWIEQSKKLSSKRL